MGMPNIPDITPQIDLEREEALTLLLASIALEEMGLAHILNSEGEKLQQILKDPDTCLEDLLAVNESVERVLQSITRLQLILQDKLEMVTRLQERDSCPPKPKPPWPRLKCWLVGCASAVVQNSGDEFYGATAQLEAADPAQKDKERRPITYTLFKRGKGGCPLSAVVIPLPEGLKVRCEQKSPCPTPEKPNSLIMEGQAVMEVQLGGEQHRGTVQFQLRVWDSGLRPRFHMVTSGEQEIFNHNSGLLEAVQGSLEIKFKRG